MRLAPLALAAFLLAGCAHPVAPRAAAGARPAALTAQAGTLELRRAIRARLMMAFEWADGDRDGILVFAEAGRLGLSEGEFRQKDADTNGALSFTELQGATAVTEEVHRLRELTVTVTDADADRRLTAAEYARAGFGVAPQPFTPSPDAGLKAKLFAPADADGDGALDRAELETAFGAATERGYVVTAGR